MGKLNLKDSFTEVITKFATDDSGFNPGAAEAAMTFFNAKGPQGVISFILLDDWGIYGEKLYKLWSDCCYRNVDEFEKVLRNMQFNVFTKEFLHQHLSETYAKPIPGLRTYEELSAQLKG